VAVDIGEYSPDSSRVARQPVVPDRLAAEISNQGQRIGIIVQQSELAGWPDLSEGRITVGCPVARERIGERDWSDKVAIVLDGDDAVKVLRADEPVVCAIAIEIVNGGG